MVVPLLVVPVIFELPDRAEAGILVADWIIWSVFFFDYTIRLYLAPERKAFVKTNRLDLLIIALPFLRPLRVVRSTRALRVLRAARATTFLGRAVTAFGEVLTRHKLHYAVATTVVVVVAGALLVHSFEQADPRSNIHSIADALWWAGATVTTVGFGDQFPTTAGGRAVGIGLMIVGISLFGFVAGSLVSYFFDNREKEGEPTLKDVIERLERVEILLEDRARAEEGSRIESQR
ncbi:MAG: potassium channel family protein [Actinomycetota bacterium]|nr:potassium channel family protein [Actinomycetota bacterium]